MKYTFVTPEGSIGTTRDFSDVPPILAEVKGRWIPNVPPQYDSMTHSLQITTPVPTDATEIPYVITPKPLDELKTHQLKDIRDDFQVYLAQDVCVNVDCFPADASHRELYVGLATIVARGLPLTMQTIRSSAGADVPLTPELVGLIESAITERVVAGWAHYNTLQSAVQASSPESIGSIEWTLA